MGIPKFYRWLSERYPQINQKITGPICPEFDCLYLDMNGIFHNCTHGLGVREGISIDEMIANIFKYISYLVQLARPKQLLYMAVDGVAPRAKQNQQRQRRFVNARDATADQEKKKAEGRAQLGTHFDHNCITPGTDFMDRLDGELRLFIRKQMAENGLWKQLNVVYSSHLCPGEGEHKIMAYIRSNKMQSDYNPNLRHCIYGLDADLIMLSLVSHEIHFALLREEVIFGARNQSRQHSKMVKKLDRKEEFQLLHISVLRQYLALDFEAIRPRLKMKYDLERIIDDFVFICCFVGNDFIPNIPTVDIATGGLEALFQVYTRLLPELDDYLINNGTLNLKPCQAMFAQLATVEKEKMVEVLKFLKKSYARFGRGGSGGGTNTTNYISDTAIEHQIAMLKISADDDADNDDDDGADEKTQPSEDYEFRTKYYNDRWTDGSMEKPADRRGLIMDYLSGMQWVLYYYYHGCVSWGWFYPHHYAPLVSDLAEHILSVPPSTFSFHLGQPFRPYEQLLAVLPIASKPFLPKPYQQLMTDPNSPIASMYPLTFTVDMNFATAPWEGIALLPFIDEQQLRKAVATIDDNSQLSRDELRRNRLEPSQMYVYDAEKAKKKLRSHGPKSFGAMNDVVSVSDYTDPDILENGGKFLARPCVGSQRCLPGFPQFSILQFTADPKKIGCQIFGLRSKYETLVLSIQSSNGPQSSLSDPSYLDGNNRLMKQVLRGKSDNDAIADLAAASVTATAGNTPVKQRGTVEEEIEIEARKICRRGYVYIGWPYLREARVVSVETCKYIYQTDHGNTQQSMNINPNDNSNNGNNRRRRPQMMRDAECFEKSQSEYFEFNKQRSKIQKQTLQMTGIDTGLIHILVTARPLTGMRRKNEETSHGSGDDSVVSTSSRIVKQWSQETVMVAAQLLVKMEAEDNREIIVDQRFKHRRINALEEFRIGTPVMYIGPETKYFGKIGRVTLAPRKGTLDIRVVERFDKCDFAYDIIRKHRHNARYFSITEAAQMAQMSPALFGRICSPVIVEAGRGESFQIGLCVKASRKGEIIPGYARGNPRYQNNYNSWDGNQQPTGFASNAQYRQPTNVTYQMEVSEKTIQLVSDYRAKFPNIFRVLQSRIGGFKFYADDFAPSKNMPTFLQPSHGGSGAHGGGAHSGSVAVPANDIKSSVPFPLGEDDATTKAASTAATTTDATTESTEEKVTIPIEDVVDNDDDDNNDDTTDAKDDSSSSTAVEKVLREAAATEPKAEEKVLTKGELRRVQKAEGIKYLIQVANWLKTLPVNELPLLSCEADTLEKEVIVAIEGAADEYYRTQKSTKKPVGIRMQTVPIQHVYASDPSVHWTPSNDKQFRLGDRVASLRSDLGVPFGTLGTVVGVHNSFLEILSDRIVVGGSTLHNRCSDGRGILLPQPSLVNLSRLPRAHNTAKPNRSGGMPPINDPAIVSASMRGGPPHRSHTDPSGGGGNNGYHTYHLQQMRPQQHHSHGQSHGHNRDSHNHNQYMSNQRQPPPPQQQQQQPPPQQQQYEQQQQFQMMQHYQQQQQQQQWMHMYPQPPYQSQSQPKSRDGGRGGGGGRSAGHEYAPSYHRSTREKRNNNSRDKNHNYKNRNKGGHSSNPAHDAAPYPIHMSGDYEPPQAFVQRNLQKQPKQ